MLKLSDFDYTLPKELIAQYPSKTRGEDRLLILDKKKNSFKYILYILIAHPFPPWLELLISLSKKGANILRLDILLKINELNGEIIGRGFCLVFNNWTY